MSKVKMPINVSPKAVKFIKQMADNNDAEPNLSLKVLPGGCSGLKYAMEFISLDDVRSTDIKVDLEEVKIFIDKDSLEYLQGISIDLDGDLMSPGLKIDNPNATGGCGCGKSFN